MTVKTNGAEFKQFYADPVYWTDDVWHEDEVLLVDGQDPGDIPLKSIPDDAAVSIEGGIVWGDRWKDNEPSFETYFKRWRRAQRTATLVVECDRAQLEAVKAAVKAAGGRVR